MLTWSETDERGTQSLVRAGQGYIKDIKGVGNRRNPEQTFSYETYRVDISIEPEKGKSKALRMMISPAIAGDSPLLAQAIEAKRTLQEVSFSVEFVRKPHVPADVPLNALDLFRDMNAVLRTLEPVTLNDMTNTVVEETRYQEV